MSRIMVIFAQQSHLNAKYLTMAVILKQKECLTPLQEKYQKFWTVFNSISANDEIFSNTFKVHHTPSIRYYQDYAVRKPYHICIMISFDKEQFAIQAYFNNLIAYEEFYNRHRNRVESMIGKILEWKEMNTKAYAQLNLTPSLLMSEADNWDKVCQEIMPYAIQMKNIFGLF